MENWAHQRREDVGFAGILGAIEVCSQTGLTSAARTLGALVCLTPERATFALRTEYRRPTEVPTPQSGSLCQLRSFAVQTAVLASLRFNRASGCTSIVWNADRLPSDRLSALTLNINSTHYLRGEELFIVKIALLLVLVTDNSFTFLSGPVDGR